MKRALVVLPVLAALVLGCKKPEAELVGNYKGTIEIPDAFKNMVDSITGGGTKPAEVSLELKADKTCTMTTTGMETSVQKGEWAYDGEKNVVSLTLTSPFLRQEDIDAMKKKGMTDEMIDKATKTPIFSAPVTDPKKLSFTLVVREMELTIHFTKV